MLFTSYITIGLLVLILQCCINYVLYELHYYPSISFVSSHFSIVLAFPQAEH
jgi:hypothetical protein